jgi:hypothetical protein
MRFLSIFCWYFILVFNNTYCYSQNKKLNFSNKASEIDSRPIIPDSKETKSYQGYALNILKVENNKLIELTPELNLCFNSWKDYLIANQIFDIPKVDICREYENGNLEYDFSKKNMPLKISFVKHLKFKSKETEYFFIKYELDNCLRGNAYYRDFVIFTLKGNKIEFDTTFTNQIKNDFKQTIFDKLDIKSDELCFTDENLNFVHTDGLIILDFIDDNIIGKYALQGNGANCCPQYSGDFEYSISNNKMILKNGIFENQDFDNNETLNQKDSEENIVEVTEKAKPSEKIAKTLFKTESNKNYDYTRIYFGDDASKVINLTTYLANLNSNSSSKVFYSNGKPKEVCIYRNNVLGLYGTLTLSINMKERYIFCGNTLCEILQEIPAFSVQKIKTILEQSNQLKHVSNFIFSEDYESIYSVYLNENQITTIQKLPTQNKKFPKNVQAVIDKAIIKNDISSENESKEEVIRGTKTEEPIVYTLAEKKPEYVGGIEAMNKFIQKNLILPKSDSTSNEETHLRIDVNLIIEKDGTVSEVKIKNKSSETEKYESCIIQCFQKMPKWNPAEQSGKPIRTVFRTPITIITSN